MEVGLFLAELVANIEAEGAGGQVRQAAAEVGLIDCLVNLIVAAELDAHIIQGRLGGRTLSEEVEGCAARRPGGGVTADDGAGGVPDRVDGQQEPGLHDVGRGE